MEFRYLVNREGRSTRHESIESKFTCEQLMSRAVVRDEKRLRYLVFDNRAAMLDAYSKLPAADRAWHEVVFGWQPQRLKFDIDAMSDKLSELPKDIIEKGLAAKVTLESDLDDYLSLLLDDQPANLSTDLPANLSANAAEAAEAVVNLLIEAILSELSNSYGIDPSRLDIAISAASGTVGAQTKFSYHLLVLPYAVADCSEAQEFTSRVLDALPECLRPLIDAGVNKRTQCFRMELSTKVGSTRVKQATDDIASTFGTASGLTVADLLVTAAQGSRILPRIQPAIGYDKQSGKKPNAVENSELEKSVIDSVLEMAEVAGVSKGFRHTDVRGTLICFQREAPSHCQLCNEIHHRDNTLYITVNQEYQWDQGTQEAQVQGAQLTNAQLPEQSVPVPCKVIEHCRHSKQTRELGTVLVAKLPPGIMFKKSESKRLGNSSSVGTLQTFIHELPNRDCHAALANQFETLPAERSMIYSETEMRDYELTETLAVCAQMKLGKTKALRRFINQHFAANGIDPPVIRFVTFRQTFGRAIQEAFPDFTLYSEAPTGVPLGAAAYPRLIVQVESLHRLPPPRGANGVVDLLILDEVESILAQFSSGLHRNFASAFANFQWMMANAKHVIAMDANLSDRTWAALADMRPAHPPRFHWNQFKRAAGDQYAFTTNQSEWITKLWVELRAQKRIVIPTNSLAEGRALEVQIIRNFPDRRVAFYSSEMAPSERSRHFADVHEYWGQLDVLIYTPTCSAGVSFEREHFDVLFGLFTDRSCDVETCRQMIGRVRNLKSRNHYIHFQTFGSNHLPESIADIRARITDKRCSLFRDSAVGPFSALGFEYDPEGMPRFYETKFFHLWLETTRIENLSKNNFVRRFIDQVADSGASVQQWEQQIPNWDLPSSDELMASHRTAKDSIRTSQCEAIAAAPNLTPEEAEDVRQALSGGSDVGPEQRAAYEKWHLRVAYDWQGRPIDTKFVKNYRSSAARRVYKNLIIACTGAADATGYATIDASLKAACASEAQRFSIAMEARSETTAAAIESRDLLRDQTTYVAFGLTIALWMIRACGFRDFLDPSFVLETDIEKRLRNVLPLLVLHAPRAVTEFEVRHVDFGRLRRENNTARFLKSALGFINSVTRIAYGVQITRLPIRSGNDAYKITWSTTGALFELVSATTIGNLPMNYQTDRPFIISTLKESSDEDLIVASRGLFIDRICLGSVNLQEDLPVNLQEDLPVNLQEDLPVNLQEDLPDHLEPDFLDELLENFDPKLLANE